MSTFPITRQVTGALPARRLGVLEHAIALGFFLLGVARIEPSPSDAVLAGVAVILLAGGAVDLRRVPRSMLVVLAFLLALNVLSAMAAVDFGAAMRFFAITLYLALLAVLLAAYLHTPERMRLAIRAYVAGAVISSGLAVLAFVLPYPGHEALLAESGTRARALFKDPNVFGPFLIPAALILLDEAMRPRLLGLRRRTATALLAVVGLGVLFAYSRAAWLNCGVALLVMLLVLSLRVDAGRAVLAALALLGVLAAVGGATIALTGSGDFLRERARVQTYDTQRFGAQRSGVELAQRHALGIGPGQFDVVQPISSHSIYVRALAEQGFGGLVALIALLAGTLALAVGNVLAGRDAYGVGSAVLLGAWCGLLANSFFIDTLHWRHLWVVAAVIWAASLRRPRPVAAS